MSYKPLTDEELNDIGYTHPPRLACPQCDGELLGDDNDQVVMLICNGTCKLVWHVPRFGGPKK